MRAVALCKNPHFLTLHLHSAKRYGASTMRLAQQSASKSERFLGEGTSPIKMMVMMMVMMTTATTSTTEVS